MEVVQTSFEGLLILKPKIFRDDRGAFSESYNQKTLLAAGISIRFVQDNQSYSLKGVLRGLHYQKSPHAQTKLVRVLSGVIQDVAVDLRRDQPTFGKYLSMDLSADDGRQLLIPAGFAHGFLVLSDSAEVLYKCDDYYVPGSEAGILYNDPALNIPWKLTGDPLLSGKDAALPTLAQVQAIL